jgi:hypothetical protein
MRVPGRRLVRSARKNSEFVWRYGFNLGPSLSYLLRRRALEGEVARVVSALDRDGIATTSIDALLGDDRVFEDLVQVSEQLVTGAPAAATTEKDFQVSLLGECPPLDPWSSYGRMALHPTVRSVANGYFRMHTQLRFYNVWRTLVVEHDPMASQLWHRDREDFLILKMFVYLRDVDADSGPFRYVPGTHRKGTVRAAPDSFLEGHVARSTDEQMAEIVPPDAWIEATGSSGTIVFADTRGFHCGGRSRTRERLMFTALYTSRASGVREWFSRSSSSPRMDDPELAFAVGRGSSGPRWVGRGR